MAECWGVSKEKGQAVVWSHFYRLGQSMTARYSVSCSRCRRDRRYRQSLLCAFVSEHRAPVRESGRHGDGRCKDRREVWEGNCWCRVTVGGGGGAGRFQRQRGETNGTDEGKY